ncbi:MAG: 30S ribosomal protein S17 [Clostridiales bacterium]|nr:30S ribosomal protein S17 [Clostridiales bacterium]
MNQENKNVIARKVRKVLVGIVLSNKMEKTIVVEVIRRTKHPIYGKVVKKTYKLKAHDQNNQCKIGDKVKVMETRPLSKEKRWKLIEILQTN